MKCNLFKLNLRRTAWWIQRLGDSMGDLWERDHLEDISIEGT
jgi:hypothetical protein